MDIRAVIMAGGVGTRFWPLSRKKRPKQFLPIISEKTMIEETAERLQPLIPYPQIYTIANADQTEAIQGILPQLPRKNTFSEPEGRNTAPSLMLATARIYHENPDAVIAALPADHLILDKIRYLEKLEAAAAAAHRGGSLITFGVPPTFPSTGFGYIHFSPKKSSDIKNERFFEVLRFKEKPKYRQAKEFLDSGDYFWNSGMFFWKASVFARELEATSPDMAPHWKGMISAIEDEDETGLEAVFKKTPATSIDYALMEQADSVLMCKGDFGWSDVGSWSALTEIWREGDESIAHRGEILSIGSEDCLIHNPDNFTALIGVRDLIVVNTEDALLICHTDKDQMVKEVVERLKKAGRMELL
ncbi:mannose-1-phosphate guanylyltransferase [Acidobacteriota bacterium]